MSARAETVGLDIPGYMRRLGEQGRAAARRVSSAETGAKNAALVAIADAILANRKQLAAENTRDLEAGRAHGLDAALLDRLELTDARIDAMAEGLRQIAALPDPVGEVTRMWRRPNGLLIGKPKRTLPP